MRAPENAYHHGDLRAALIAAADEELSENGLNGFTLRGCARRAGVSHAAPAHHFKDITALLAEVAANGFERLAEITERFGSNAPLGTIEQLAETARGYLTFASEYPHHFRLIFNGERYDRTNPRLQAAGAAAFRVPVEAIGSYRGSADPMSDPDLIPQVVGLWSIVHGFSDLMLLGQLTSRPGVTRRTLIDEMMPKMIRQFFENGVRKQKPASRPRSVARPRRN
ncbi:MAG: TetR/AcrR family transcriptional regulator [Bauldia sp.]